MTASESADGVTTLCRWAAGVDFDTLPGGIVRRAALVVADALAAVVAARDEPEVRPLQEHLISSGA